MTEDCFSYVKIGTLFETLELVVVTGSDELGATNGRDYTCAAELVKGIWLGAFRSWLTLVYKGEE